jgi:hypothetical protein
MENRRPYICERKASKIIWLGTIVFVFAAMLFGHYGGCGAALNYSIVDS